MKKPNGYWTKERCKEEALKYKTRKDFQFGNVSAYNRARINKYLDEICSHMNIIKKPNNYWTKEKCKEEALKYDYLTDFRKNSKTAYKVIYGNMWNKELLNHMKRDKKPSNYWTKEKCRKEALKYESRFEFHKRSSRAYVVSNNNDWLDEFCFHMKPKGNRYKRCIYVYEFSDNYAYIGLTYDLDKRNYNHMKKGTVYNYKNKTKIKPTLIQLTDYIDVEEAKKKESEYVKKYKKNNWNILNIIKTGGIGKTPIIWTKERCKEEALKYNNKRDFRKNSNAYYASHKNGWIDEICSHMERLIKPKGYWTKERCKEEVLKYNYRESFRKGCSSAYNKSYNEGWLNEFFN